MKRLGLAMIGVSLIAAVALKIHARYFDGPKLCIGVMVQMMWAKNKDQSPGMFIRETADLSI
jgi:hypothetical protein